MDGVAKTYLQSVCFIFELIQRVADLELLLNMVLMISVL